MIFMTLHEAKVISSTFLFETSIFDITCKFNEYSSLWIIKRLQAIIKLPWDYLNVKFMLNLLFFYLYLRLYRNIQCHNNWETRAALKIINITFRKNHIMPVNFFYLTAMSYSLAMSLWVTIYVRESYRINQFDWVKNLYPSTGHFQKNISLIKWINCKIGFIVV